MALLRLLSFKVSQCSDVEMSPSSKKLLLSLLV